MPDADVLVPAGAGLLVCCLLESDTADEEANGENWRAQTRTDGDHGDDAHVSFHSLGLYTAT